ncbi:MAG: cell division protein FtsQ [Candidatus Omnitrophica bacterium]|nr:cell division protein FtsQ [Candidatus Omnitrophota bacterium]
MPYFKAKIAKSGKQKRDKARGPGGTASRKKLIVSLAILFALALTATSFYLFYFKSSHFVVRELILAGKTADSTVNYTDLQEMIVGKNIFMLGLNGIRRRMLQDYPELSDLRLSRAFPATVMAKVILRYPIAQIHKGLYYPVDSDAVLLSKVKESPDNNLPIISGIRMDVSMQVGSKAESKRVKKALYLLKELDSSGILGEHKLVEIDVSSIRNTIFFLEDGLEIKIGHEEYASRLNNLKTILQDTKIRPEDIRYIDLRFKEPVIGPKWKR